MTGLPEQGSRKGQEESGKQNHQWAKNRVCYTYETSLETQAQSDKVLECHISSRGQKYQQLWLRLKYGAQRINVFFIARVTECKKLLGKQLGVWMKWDLPERMLIWTELWRKSQFRI